MSYFGAVNLKDENGTPYGVKHIGNKPRVVSTPYLYSIAEGDVTDHKGIRILGYNGDVDAAYEDLWDAGGSYVVPAAAQQMEVYSSSDEDAGVVIKSGTSDSITAGEPSGGATTLTLTDAAVDFTAATAVLAGDLLLLDGDGVFAHVLTVAETVITASTTSDYFATSAQAYRIVDNSAAQTGVRVVEIDYLDSTYAERAEFLVTNGTTVVTTASVDILRVNAFHTVFAGTSRKAVGAVDIRHVNDTPIYRRIAIGNNRSNTAFYTVPLGKTIYITNWHITETFTTVNRYAIGRLRVTATDGNHYVPNLFFDKGLLACQDGIAAITVETPILCPQKSDIKISVSCPDTNGVCTGSFSGWIE